MLTITTAQQIMADMLFDGSMLLAGLTMYVGVLAIMFLLSKNIVAILIIAIPVTLMFASLGILAGDILIVLILIIVIGLGLSAKGLISG